jgi:hypothetical protein
MHIRKAIAAFLLIASLVFPTGVFAATSSSSTAESLSIASTVSMTAQASATYVLGDEDGANGPDWTGTMVLTVLSSNNPSGVTTSATVDPFATAGGINVATTQRLTLLQELDCASPNQVIGVFTCPAAPAPVAASGSPLVKAGAQLPLGTFVDDLTSIDIAASTGPLANADLGIQFIIDADAFPVGGTYTSGAHWTTTTNP